jgi:hypothetical protein
MDDLQDTRREHVRGDRCESSTRSDIRQNNIIKADPAGMALRRVIE